MIKQRQKNASYKRLDKNESDSDDEETELFVRSKPQRREIPSVEKVVQEGDTLQSLAIRYRCTIEDLKRLNGIHKENEIFARPTIRVPNRPFTSALAGVHSSGRTSPNSNNLPSTSQTVDVASLDTRLKNSLLKSSNGENAVNEIIFNSSFVQKPSDRLDEVGEEFHEGSELLGHREFVVADPVVSKLNCNGADCGISWVALIICILILIFAAPLIYVFYIAEHQHHDHEAHGS